MLIRSPALNPPNRSPLPAASLFLAAFVLSVAQSVAALTVADVQVVNITPSSFSVVWTASEPGTPSISVFSDAAGTQNLAGQVGIELFPLNTGSPNAGAGYERRQNMSLIRNKTRNLGLMHLQVSPCRPATTYFFKVTTRIASGETAAWPASGPLPSITTPLENAFVPDSRQLLITIPGNDLEGRILTLTSANATHPLAAVVADGAAPNQVYFNLSDLFALAGGKNFIPTGSQDFELNVLGPDIPGASSRFSLGFTTEFAVANADRRTVGREFLALAFGTSVVRAGGSGQVLINLDNSPGMAELVVALDTPPGLLTDLSLTSLTPDALVSLQPLGTGKFRVAITAAPGKILQGKLDVARLNFTAAPGQTSSFVPLTISDISATKPDLAKFSNLFAGSGRVVVIAEQPLLEATFAPDRSRLLTLFGKANTDYQIQASTDLGENGAWSNWTQVHLTSLSQDIPNLRVDSPNYFYRALELFNRPSLSLTRKLDGTGLIRVSGPSGERYQLQSTPNLSSPIEWRPLLTFTIQDASHDVDNLDLSGPRLFYRLVQPPQ